MVFPRWSSPTLAGLLEEGALDPGAAIRLLGQVAGALDAANARGLVHRQLEPRGILVEPRDGGRALLTDFGLLRPEPSGNGVEPPGAPAGSYLSPEEARGEPVGLASSVYSLASVLYACLTGKAPRAGVPQALLVWSQLGDLPPRVSEARPELACAIDDVVAAGMSADPGARPASAAELVRAAAEALKVGTPPEALQGPRAAAPPPPVPEPAAPPRAAFEPAPPPPAAPDRAPTPPAAPDRAPTPPPVPESAPTLPAAFGPAPPEPAAPEPAAPAPAPPDTFVWPPVPHQTDAPPASARRRRHAKLALAIAVPVGLLGVAGYALGREGRASSTDPVPVVRGQEIADPAAQARRAELRRTAATLEDVDGRRARERERLARARTRAAQAAAAVRLGDAYDALAARLDPLPASGALPAALRRAARAYWRLAAAAGGGLAPAYARASEEVRRAEARAERVVRRLARD